MKASIVDLRYKTREILEALERNENVTVLYHGRVKGVIHPAGRQPTTPVTEHAFFAMHAEAEESVADEMDRLRRARQPAP
jgi:antitoxin (DNA-binding transcriptional repressor) of toxin-antitoxin stability system